MILDSLNSPSYCSFPSGVYNSNLRYFSLDFLWYILMLSNIAGIAYSFLGISVAVNTKYGRTYLLYFDSFQVSILLEIF